MKSLASFWFPLVVILASSAGCSGGDDEGGSNTGGSTASGGGGGSSASGGSGGSSASGGSGGSSATGGSTGDGGLPAKFGDTACMQCIATACATQFAACNADATCKAYFDCVLACPPKNSHEADETCTGQCPNQSSAALTAVGECYKDAVDAACSVPCG